jgi:ketopantoate reductase
MLLDAEKGQPIEVEVIFGEVVRMARERRIDVPVSHFSDSIRILLIF